MWCEWEFVCLCQWPSVSLEFGVIAAWGPVRLTPQCNSRSLYLCARRRLSMRQLCVDIFLCVCAPPLADTLSSVNSRAHPKSFKLVHQATVFATSGPQVLDVRGDNGAPLPLAAGDVVGIGARSPLSPVYVAVNSSSSGSAANGNSGSASAGDSGNAQAGSALLVGPGVDPADAPAVDLGAIGCVRRFLPLQSVLDHNGVGGVDGNGYSDAELVTLSRRGLQLGFTTFPAATATTAQQYVRATPPLFRRKRQFRSCRSPLRYARV